MTELLDETGFALSAWVERANALGWLDGKAAERLESFRLATPGQLFDTPERPLIAGLFGGTGVGKSALLNRLAGAEIARSSAERPTSRSMTAYLHRSVRADRLPPEFPTERINMAIHQDDANARILWLDMPDLDSAETEHRALVEQWLPYIDVIVYVVSPERYRDDTGWRLMLQHRREHAWVFVFNQWDRAEASQLQQFRSMLNDAGLAEPQLYRVSSHPDPDRRVPDDFAALTSTLQSLSAARWVEELEQRGITSRLQALGALAAEFRPTPTPAVSATAWLEHWDSAAPSVFGQSVAGRINALVPQALQSASEIRLIDALGQQQLDTQLLQRQQALAEAGVPLAVTQRHFQPLRERLPGEIEAAVQAELQASLAEPGTLWQRRLHQILGWLVTLLPLATLGWAGWRLLAAWQAGASDPEAYVGVDFAINAALMTAVAFALPWYLHRRTRPSPEQAARRGLKAGLERALRHVGTRVGDVHDAIATEATTLNAELDARLAGVGSSSAAARQDWPEALRGMLFADGKAPDA